MTKKLQGKSYSEAFRQEAARLSEQPGRNATEVARELRIHAGHIHNWRAQFNPYPTEPPSRFCQKTTRGLVRGETIGSELP
jgi:transposase-like protein